jgi:hypothetical protein
MSSEALARFGPCYSHATPEEGSGEGETARPPRHGLIETTSIAAPAEAGSSALFAGLRELWVRFFATAFHPYRPELHYMRGPGPAWRAKHGMDAPFRLIREI